jgi:hypothetical protein
MADTGSPWNIPYAEPTDLVRDWPALSEDVADAVAAGLTAAGPAGIGSNVVQTVKTDTFSTTSATFTAITGLAATITPSTDTSKILVVVNVQLGQSTENVGAHIQVLRGATPIYLGDASGSRVRASATYVAGDAGVVDTATVTCVALDSPAVDTATTYSVELRRGSSGTAYVGRTGFDGNNENYARVPASITLIEVKA